MSDPVEQWGRDADGNFEPYRLAHALQQKGEDWANKAAAADLLEKTSPAVLAQLTNEIRAAEGGSRKVAEDLALGSAAYLEHIQARVEARRVANIARANYDAIRVLIDAMRTVEATRREELKSYRGGR